MNKKLIILGAGESGVGAALLGHRHGYDVFVSDANVIENSYKKELSVCNISFEELGHSLSRILDADVIIKSPGIPETAAIIIEIRKKGIELISEIEFGYRFCNGKIIGITGSNGKTTTSLLIDHIINKSEFASKVVGNVGTSFCRVLAQDAVFEYYVIELSSFQLDDIIEFRPNIAILLNITADHLDRYDYNINKYAKAKANIYKNQTNVDLLITNGEDDVVAKTLLHFPPKSIVEYVTSIESGYDEILSYSQLEGMHNRFNTTCAILACQAIGLSDSIIEKGLANFNNHPHRLEKIAVLDGVLWINDSKATNVDSVQFALDAMTKPVVWIAGGTDKGNEYAEIKQLASNKVKALICLGVDNEKLKSDFKDELPQIEECQSMQDAVVLANSLAVEGDVVLLSPACASFDLFDNYMDRGNQFKKEIWKQFKMQLS